MMKTWRKALLGVFVVASLTAAVCAVAGVNPVDLLACVPSDPGCRR